MAMFIAPVLAIIAYFAVDHVVSETPHVAIPGDSYKLLAKSNCRYESGTCTLKNGDIEANIKVEKINDNQVELVLRSELPIQGVIISFVEADKISEPISMKATDDGWRATLDKINSDQSILRLALNVSGTLYYAETTTIFFDYETAFSRENFSY